MIVGQILIDGAPFSIHRYPEHTFTLAELKGRLTELAYEEQLFSLGRVEIRAHVQRGLERLVATLLGKA